MNARLFAVKAPADVSALPFDAWINEVPEPRRTRILRQRNAQSAAAQLCADRLLGYALRRLYGLDVRALDQRVTPEGKPYFDGPQAPHFSISHSHAMALCALHGAPVGADVERVRRVRDALARRIMSDAEYAAYLASPDPVRFFFRIWTLKESFVKQTGLGIAQDLKKLEFSMDEALHVTFSAPGYAFRLYDLPGNYQACACTGAGTLPGAVTVIELEALVPSAGV
jgi:4'-phosphopantetheinyl transferase